MAAFFRLYRIEALPPGDRYDPAFYGVDALRVLSGERPIFFYDWVGQHKVEPLFSYLVALCFLVVGPSTLGIHLAAALVGIATVPAVYLAARSLFARLPDEEHLLKRWGALAAALMVAVSYWHLTWSRYGVRAILVPLFASLVSASLWRGLSGNGSEAASTENRRRPSGMNGQRTGSFVACGVLLGASMYTYQAARLLPVLVVIGFTAVVWNRQEIARGDLTSFLIVTVTALLVFAPLAVYFLRHPDSFSTRIQTVLVVDGGQGVAGNITALGDQLRRTALSFVVGVDDAPYRVLPGRPSLNPLFSALFITGLGFTLRRIKQPVYLFLLAWLLLLSVPATLADQGAAAKRAIGTLPAVAMLIAVGALAPWQILNRRFPEASMQRWVARGWGALMVGVFAYAGLATYRDYFIKWASLPGLFTHFEVHRAAVGEFIGALPPHEHVYVSPEIPTHPVIRFHSGLREDVQGYNGRVCFVIPEQTRQDTTYVIGPAHDRNSLDLLASYAPQGQVVHRGGWHTGDPSFVAYRIPSGSGAELPMMDEVSATWEGRIQLLGYTLDRDDFHAGDSMDVTLYYRALQTTDQRHTAFLHLLGPENAASGDTLWAQDDSEPCHGFYPTSSWDRGEIIVDRISLAVPDEAPENVYRLTMGFYQTASGHRLRADGDSVLDHNIALLGNVDIGARPEH